MLSGAAQSPTKRKLTQRAPARQPSHEPLQLPTIDSSQAASRVMSLRNIRPSFSEASPSTSASVGAPSQSARRTSESTSSGPRYPAPSGDVKTKDSTASISKRRRVPDSITRNACMNCKKARAKCDGQKPCTRCDTRSETTSCVYEVHIKHAKEELMKQITDLRAKNRHSERIHKALRSDVYAPRVLELIRNGEPCESIADWLEREAPSDHRDHDGYSNSPGMGNNDMQHGYDQDMNQAAPLYWTSVQNVDAPLLEHLFQLYFAWIHPVYTLLSERHFTEAFANRTGSLCSSLLVNAICALACILRSEVDQEDSSVWEPIRMDFCQAFKDEFDPADKRITTIQATAIMFLVELSRGKPLAGPYLKQATESIIEMSGPLSNNAPSILCKPTIQGIRNLNVLWAQATFTCPQFFDTFAIETVATDDEENLDTKFWYFYCFENDRIPGWPSMLSSVNRERVNLMKIINDVCALLYGPSPNKITATQILELYSRFITWFNNLPPHLVANLENKSQALPHILSLLILYNHSVTQLLRPLIDLKDFPSLLVEEAIFTHAQRGLSLLEHYRHNFTCRYQPILQMFTLASLCDLVARYFPHKSSPKDKDGSEALMFGLDSLQESYANNSGFPIAGVLRELLRLAPATYTTTISMPKSYDYHIANPRGNTPNSQQQQQKSAYCTEEFMEAVTRATYFQPLVGVREKFEKGLAQNWLGVSERFGMKRPDVRDRSLRVLEGEPDRGTNYLMQIKNLLNNS